MVLQLILPKEGGGALRRFAGIWGKLYRDKWNDSRPFRGPVPLFDLRRSDDAADAREISRPKRIRGLYPGWRVSDDSVIGGFSTSTIELKEPDSSPPYIRWRGNLSTKVDRQSHLARNVTRSGFASVMTPEIPLSAPLENRYQALEICCRTDGRTYAVNLHCETYFPDDIYQGFIAGGDPAVSKGLSDKPDLKLRSSKIDEDQWGIEPGAQHGVGEILDVRELIKQRKNLIAAQDPNNDPYHGYPPDGGFMRFILPFKDFMLTSRGRMRTQQRALDNVFLESIGFTLMDGKDGDFCFDLISIRAVNVLEGDIVGSLEDEEREDALLRSFHENSKREGSK